MKYKRQAGQRLGVRNDGLHPLREVPPCLLRAASAGVGMNLSAQSVASHLSSQRIPLRPKPAHHDLRENCSVAKNQAAKHCLCSERATYSSLKKLP